MFVEGTKPDQVTEEKAKAVLAAVDEFRERTRRTWSGIARAIGYSPATISQVVKGSYAGNWREIILDLDRWLDDERKHDAAPKVGEFVWTKVAQEIQTIADAAVAMRSIGLVYGPDTSGIGKSITLRALRAEKPGSILVTVQKSKTSSGSLLRQIAQAMGIRVTLGITHHGFLFDTIVEQLKDTPRLLMLDQIHSLCDARPDDSAFFQLMDLFDAAHNPQLWCGTRDIVGYLNRRIGRGEGKETLAQIRRRIYPRRDLMARTRSNPAGGKGEPLYTIDEIRAVFGKNKIRLTSDAYRFLLELANRADSGALGAAVALVRCATLIGDKQGIETITAEHLRQAMGFLVADEAAMVNGDMEEREERAMKVG